MRIFMLFAILLTSTGCSMERSYYNIQEPVQFEYQGITHSNTATPKIQISANKEINKPFFKWLGRPPYAQCSALKSPFINSEDSMYDFINDYTITFIKEENGQYIYNIEPQKSYNLLINDQEIFNERVNDLLSQLNNLTQDITCTFPNISEYSNLPFTIPRQEFINYVEMFINTVRLNFHK